MIGISHIQDVLYRKTFAKLLRHERMKELYIHHGKSVTDIESRVKAFKNILCKRRSVILCHRRAQKCTKGGISKSTAIAFSGSCQLLVVRCQMVSTNFEDYLPREQNNSDESNDSSSELHFEPR